MRWWAIILLIAVALAAYAIYSIQRQPVESPSNQFGIIPGIANIEYRDGEYGFSIMYPEIAALSQANFEGYLPLTETPIASFVLPESMYTGTNLAEAGVYIGATTTPEVVAECLSAAPKSGEFATATTTINGVVYSVFVSMDAAAGNIYETNVYRTIRGERCFEIVMLLHSTNIGNYEPGTVAEFDKAKFTGYLAAVVRTFSFI